MPKLKQYNEDRKASFLRFVEAIPAELFNEYHITQNNLINENRNPRQARLIGYTLVIGQGRDYYTLQDLSRIVEVEESNT